MHNPSAEQLKIINAIERGSNVIVKACPGAGKSFLILSLASRIPHKQILQITYSSNLKEEVRKKAEKYNLQNLDVHSYHSLGYKYYLPGTYNDQDIYNILREDIRPIEQLTFDILIIDEAQDMTSEYYELMRKVSYDLGCPHQLVLMGDPKQCIFGYKGANPKFLTEGNTYWPELEFKTLSLTISYRLTDEIAAIINVCMINNDYPINTVKSGPEVLYLVKKDGSDSERLGMLVEIIQKYLLSFRPEDIIILCPSVNMTSTKNLPSLVAILINKLTRIGIDINRPLEDGSANKDPKLTKDKISLLSFHQSKGLEAPVTIIFGFDDSYFKYYGREYDINVCPSPLYVAISRASHHLILFQQREILPFIQHIEENSIYYDDSSSATIPVYPSTNSNIVKLAINKITKHLSSTLVKRLTTVVDDLFVEDNTNTYDIFESIPDTIFTGKTHEYVSDLIYIAIISRYEYTTIGASTLVTRIKNLLTYLTSTPQEILQEFLSLCNETQNSMLYWLKVANIYDALSHKLIYRLKQIKNYNWISEDQWTQIYYYMNNVLPKDNLIYETPIGEYHNTDNYRSYKYKSQDKIVKLTGKVDGYNQNTVWLFKFSGILSIETKLQLILQAWMIKQSPLPNTCENWNSLQFKIFNIKTGSVWTLANDFATIDKITQLLVENRV
jgi:hypothetical protein